ncbi:hypothetical protein ACN28E_24905 [Archangium lansingense]|uniref:hypothetical protein n=1 Tax=Archangium lansingense TaxID=2995310 RepID=UPI003B7EA5D7
MSVPSQRALPDRPLSQLPSKTVEATKSLPESPRRQRRSPSLLYRQQARMVEPKPLLRPPHLTPLLPGCKHLLQCAHPRPSA